MDSRDYEFDIIADPSADIDESGLDEAGVEAARALRDEMRALDARIARALAIDVPALKMPDLPPIETDDNVTHIATSNKRPSLAPAWLAMAASVALVAVIGAQFLTSGADRSSLAAEVIAHLEHEPAALTVTTTPVDERRLASVVSDGGADINRNVGLITYARSCVINGKTVPHLVMQGESGPITLLLMPGEAIDEAIPLSGDSVTGVILPVSNGSIAIIGEHNEDIGRIEKQVIDSVTWSI